MIMIEQIGRSGKIAVGQQYESQRGILFGLNPLPLGRFDLTYNAPYDPETACIDPRNFCIPNLGLKGNDLYLLEGKRDRS